MSADVILCAITSSLKQLPYSINIHSADIESGVLHEQSMIKVESIFKIHKSLIIKPIAKLKEPAFLKIYSFLSELFKSSQ